MASDTPGERTGFTGRSTPGVPFGSDGPEAQLQQLRDRLRTGNAELYRHLALYLQVLRQVLPARVEHALFHLATQVQPGRYASLPARDRRQLHRRCSTLVHRCSSLLTVEQLCTLASQMARERERQEHRDRRRLLQSLATPGGGSAEADSEAPRSATHPVGAAGAGPLPVGSVDLDGSAPFRGGLMQRLEPLGLSPAVAAPAPSEKPGEEESQADELPGLLQRLLSEGTPRAGSRAPGGDPWRAGQLPEEPLRLLRWLEGVERALERRLRNLSHAINVELLRVGFSTTLLPVSLLDGVLAGQIDPQPAPPNLLRLQIPFPAEESNPLQVMALLLRSVDLELEEPRLRTCRRRLQQHRLEVRRMAQQFRRLQRRREALEAEQLWLQDRHASHSPPA